MQPVEEEIVEHLVGELARHGFVGSDIGVSCTYGQAPRVTIHRLGIKLMAVEAIVMPDDDHWDERNGFLLAAQRRHVDVKYSTATLAPLAQEVMAKLLVLEPDRPIHVGPATVVLEDGVFIIEAPLPPGTWGALPRKAEDAARAASIVAQAIAASGAATV